MTAHICARKMCEMYSFVDRAIQAVAHQCGTADYCSVCVSRRCDLEKENGIVQPGVCCELSTEGDENRRQTRRNRRQNGQLSPPGYAIVID